MDDIQTYIGMTYRNSELYHHGIQGQKWGVQNGPPYPLGSDISTGSRLKNKDKKMYNAQGKKIKEKPIIKNAKSKEKLELIAANPKRPPEMEWISMSKNSSGEYVPTATLLKDPSWPRSQKGYTDEKMKSVNSDKKKYERQLSVEKYVSQFLWLTPGGQIPSSILSSYIPKKLNEIDALSNNCAKCSNTMALRIMGYDDIKAGKSLSGYTQKDQFSWWDGAKVYGEKKMSDGVSSGKDLKSIEAYEKIKDLKNESFGTMSLKWAGGGGHSIAWYKGNDGVIKLIDAQTQKTVDIMKDESVAVGISKLYNGMKIKETGGAIFDLTNAKPNFDNMAKYSVIELSSTKKTMYATKDEKNKKLNSNEMVKTNNLDELIYGKYGSITVQAIRNNSKYVKEQK